MRRKTTRPVAGRMEKRPLRPVLILLALCALASMSGCLGGAPAEIERGTGSISVTSEPDGVAITLNGAPRGAAYLEKPLEIKGVPYGRHAVGAEFPDHVPQVVEVDVRAERVPVRIRLGKEGAGRLVVESIPPGAEVFISSRYYGVAGPAVEVTSLAPGEYPMWLRLSGYRMERRNIIVERRRERRYLIVLEKES